MTTPTLTEAPRRGDWQQTFSGRKFWPLDPRPEDIDLHDIAHALGMVCRFCGHVRSFWSVAAHSVLVSYLAPKEFAVAALLHDASEAYISDLTRPLKSSFRQADQTAYDEAENAIMLAAAARFGAAMVGYHEADDAALVLEAKLLLPGYREWPNFEQRHREAMGMVARSAANKANTFALRWLIGCPPISPQEGKMLFLDRAAELGIA